MLEVRCALNACDDSGPAVVACVCTSTYVVCVYEYLRVCSSCVRVCVAALSAGRAHPHGGGCRAQRAAPHRQCECAAGAAVRRQHHVGACVDGAAVLWGQHAHRRSTDIPAAGLRAGIVLCRHPLTVTRTCMHAHMFTAHSRASAEWARGVRVCVLTCVCLGWQRLSLDGFELLAALRVRGLIDWGPFPLNSTDWNDGSYY